MEKLIVPALIALSIFFASIGYSTTVIIVWASFFGLLVVMWFWDTILLPELREIVYKVRRFFDRS